jgi:hypothetical protein
MLAATVFQVLIPFIFIGNFVCHLINEVLISLIESYKRIDGVTVKTDVNLYSNNVIKQIKNANQL